MTRDSVRAHLFFQALAAGSTRVLVRVAADHEDGTATLAGAAEPAQLAHAALLASTPSRTWLLAPVEALPPDARIALHVQPGVLGADPEGGIEARAAMSFDTFAPFSFLGVACTDVTSRERSYAVWLPQPLQAHRGYHVSSAPAALHDAFARPLAVCS